MDSEVFYRVLALLSASCLFILCTWILVRYMISSKGDPVLLKLSLLEVGLFTAMIIGFVILFDTVRPALAGGFTVALLIIAFVLYFFFKSRWKAQEQEQREQIEELKATVESLRDQADANQVASLSAACGRAAKEYDLTRREEEVLGFLLQGLSYAEIERRLYLSHSTVKSHVRNLYRKMGVNRRESLSQKIDGYS